MRTTAVYKFTVRGHEVKVGGILVKSQLANYGNGSAVLLDIECEGRETEDCLDTRYESNIVKDFPAWLKGYIKDAWTDAENIERVW